MTKPPVTSERKAQFAALIDEHGDALWRFALWLTGDKAVAEDVVQETWLRAWRYLHQLEDKKKAKSWLITIVRREHARLFERKRPDVMDLTQLPLKDEDGVAPEDNAEIRQLREEIGKLAPKYREPLLMQVTMGLSCEDIAEQLGISKSAVMTQLFRAREQLKRKLNRKHLIDNIHELG